ncbi:hypothetical protein [Vibrio mediterranei]|uniref:hypothetical protein n=1 Tax=Vibrio mediterranei TaxID=689 RepID=UPI00148BBC77|nr:hypothetical protein [Vibrio mediterranei]NOI26537.1 hypothetical protein [Vibrio mediterranei]
MEEYNRFNLEFGRRIITALVLFTALLAMPSVIRAQTVVNFDQSNGFMGAVYTSDNGLTIEQIANTRVFPDFTGTPKHPDSLAVTAVGKNVYRSVKILVARSDSDSSLFLLRAGNVAISARVSDSALAVTTEIGIPQVISKNTSYKMLMSPVPKNVKYLLFTASILPGSYAQSQWLDKLIITANEAEVHDSIIVMVVRSPVRWA